MGQFASGDLPCCWEMMDCGRIPGGPKEKELGACPAYPSQGRSCWMTAGTFCGGKPQGEYASKMASCMLCEVFRCYNPVTGSAAAEFRQRHPKEFACVTAAMGKPVANRG